MLETDEKNRILWRVAATLAVNLALLVLLCSVTGNAAYSCLGCTGERVAVIQRSLRREGLYGGEISGMYDLSLRKGIKKFQQEHGLYESGEADGKTCTLLGISSKSGQCFHTETELLARYLQVKYPSAHFPELLNEARQIAESVPSLAALLRREEDILKLILDAEPSSEAYEAACEALYEK